MLVVEPTNTWHAYDVTDGDSWYLTSSVHVIDLTHPFAGTDVRGGSVPAGLPEQFWRFDLGFLRWYWRSGYRADFVSDDDLEHISSANQLSRYRLIVFAGHEEYVTSHTYDADHGLPGCRRQPRLPGREQLLLPRDGAWRHDGRPHPLARPRAARGGARRLAVRRLERGQVPEPALPHRRHSGRAVAVRGHAAPRRQPRSAATGSRSTSRTRSRPPARTSSPTIPNEFGPGKSANMTIYQRGRSTCSTPGRSTSVRAPTGPRLAARLQPLEPPQRGAAMARRLAAAG